VPGHAPPISFATLATSQPLPVPCSRLRQPTGILLQHIGRAKKPITLCVCLYTAPDDCSRTVPSPSIGVCIPHSSGHTIPRHKQRAIIQWNVQRARELICENTLSH
jgi:hypothetical protein